jgi:hypothetical protein
MNRLSPRVRRVLSVVLAVVVALSLSVALIGAWVQSTLFDASALSRRSVHALDSEAVRHQVAVQLTDQLVKSGNRQVIAFRPAAQLTVEALVDSDAFKSLFATAVRRTHGSLLAGTGAKGLDLSDTLELLASGLSLNSQAKSLTSGAPKGGSFADTVSAVANLPIWDWRQMLLNIEGVAVVLSLACAVGSILVAYNRRKGVVRVGVAAVAGSGLAFLAILVVTHYARQMVNDSDLRQAVGDAIWAVTSDLRARAVAFALMGVVVAAAAAPNERFAPEQLRSSALDRYQRVRASVWGTAGLAAALVVVGLMIITWPQATSEIVMWMLGLGMVFTAARLTVGLAQRVGLPADDGQPAKRSWWGWGMAVAGVVAIAGLFSYVSVSSARASAEGAYARTCMGSEALCDRRLDQITLAGAHNAMSSPAYKGWLFAEQIESIGGQLNKGVRVLLIDAHYGRQSTVKVPGSNVNLTVTDIAAEFAVPDAEVPDAALKAKAEALAADASKVGSSPRGVYLCHNYCELGAVTMTDEMSAVRRFLQTNPDQIVMIVVQDAVSSKDVAKVVTDAGLLDHVATLTPGQPLPTLGELVDTDKRLVMFAERGDGDAPDWYPRAYEWFEETPYKFDQISEFNCDPNRGTEGNPLFLMNHWVGRSPPDPKLAKKANATAVLGVRVRECVSKRGRVPNVIAADFATTGDIVATARPLTDTP